MANPEMKKLTSLTVDELHSQIRDIQAALFEKKMQAATGQLQNHAQVWKSRKTMARLQTLLTRRALKGEVIAVPAKAKAAAASDASPAKKKAVKKKPVAKKAAFTKVRKKKV